MPITHKACLPLVRLGEPSFMTKANCQFDIPATHLSTRYRDIGDEVLERVHDDNAHKLPVKPIHKYSDLKFVKGFSKRATFSPFNQQHCKYANELVKIFDEAKDIDELISIALYARDEVNKQLFAYAYYLVLTHRYDTDSIQLPQFFEIAPNHFFKKSILQRVTEKCHKTAAKASKARAQRQTTQNQEPVDIPFRATMSVSNPEEKLAFFREDIGVSSHHFHWHVVYPLFGPSSKFYDKDRRGEIFYYMHHQLVNTYHCNRLALKVAPVVPFDNFRSKISEGYFPDMTASTSSFSYPPRQNDTHMQDLNRFGDNARVADLERWHERLTAAIDNGYYIDTTGKQVAILNDSGFNTFVNLMEANMLSVNTQYYGDLHNTGHRLIAGIHDPDGKFEEPDAVMGDNTTAVRDPMFFRWHQMIDDLCHRLKNRLPLYSPKDLAFNGISIQSLDLLDANNNPLANNQFITYWQKSVVNLQYGLDFHTNAPILVRFTHLNYQHFSYSLKIQNSNSSAVQGTIRIFLLPIYDYHDQQYDFDEARTKAIEIDRFVTKFSPGSNRVVRKSSDSSMTISYDRTFPMQLDGEVLLSNQPDDIQTVCMCGWPQHMLLPKGTQDGYPFRLFVMISDYNNDKIDQPPSNGVCNDNYILCGLRNRKYPDARSMGFPFDRPANPNILEFEDFTAGHSNMISMQVTVRHPFENTAQNGDNANDIVKI